jgi:hypothetical protein
MGGELIEYSGILTSGAADGACTGNTPTASTTLTSGSYTYTSGDLILAGLTNETDSVTISQGNMTLVQADSTHIDAEEEGTATGSSQTTTFTSSSAPTANATNLLVCAFKV